MSNVSNEQDPNNPKIEISATSEPERQSNKEQMPESNRPVNLDVEKKIDQVKISPMSIIGETPQTVYIDSNSELKQEKESEKQLKSDNKVPEEAESDDYKNAVPIPGVEPPVPQNNIGGATFILANTSLGTTIFTFAVRCKQFGLVWFVIFLVLGAVLNVWTILRMVAAVDKIKERDYSKVVEKVLGKSSKMLLNVFMGLYCLGFVMTYVSLIFSLIGRFIHGTWYYDQYETFDDYKDAIWYKAQYRWSITFGYSIVLFFVCLIKDMSKLNFAGYIGIIAVIYTVFIVLIQTNKYYNYYKEHTKTDDPKTHMNVWDFSKAFTSRLNIFKGMAQLFAAYSCHNNIYPVYETFSYSKGGKYKMTMSVIYSQSVVAVLQIICVICSFLTEPILPEDLIVYRANRFGGADIWMGIAKLMVGVCLFFSTPLFYVGIRSILVNMFFNGKLTNLANYTITGSTFLICATVACVYDRILSYLNYIGGFTAVLFSYLFPIMLYIEYNQKGYKYWKNALEFGIAILLCFIGVMAGILTIIDDIKGYNANDE